MARRRYLLLLVEVVSEVVRVVFAMTDHSSGTGRIRFHNDGPEYA